MTPLEIFYTTGSIFFVLFTIGIVVVIYYIVKTLKVIRFALSNVNMATRLITNYVGKAQLGTITFLLGLVRNFIKRR